MAPGARSATNFDKPRIPIPADSSNNYFKQNKTK